MSGASSKKAQPVGQPQIDLRVLQLLCSKLCHDLVGPVGAVNNGVELVREMAAGMDNEAMELIGSSARQVAERLQFFRVAFGLGGAVRTSLEARNLLTRGVIGAKKELVWPAANDAAPIQLDDTGLKLLLNMVYLSSGALPRGGRVDVHVEPSGDVLRLTVTAGGTGVALHEEARRALAGEMSVRELTPRVVQHYYTHILARQQGSGIGVDYPHADLLTLRAVALRVDLVS